MKIIIIFPDDARLENTCQKNCKRWRMIRKYAQNLLSRVRRSEKSVQELWLPSAVREDLGKHGTREHSIPPEQISFFPNLHCQPSPPFGLRKLMTAPCESHPLYLSDISSWDGRSVRCNIGMCMRQIFPGLTQNYKLPFQNIQFWRRIRVVQI